MLLISKILLYPSGLLGIYLFSVGIAKLRTPKLNQGNICAIGKKCVDILKIRQKVDFVLQKKIRMSHTQVVKKGRQYRVIIKDIWLGHNASAIIHELTHIKTGQADKVDKLPDTVVSRIRFNLYYDLFYAWPNELKYHSWIRKNCR